MPAPTFDRRPPPVAGTAGAVRRPGRSARLVPWRPVLKAGALLAGLLALGFVLRELPPLLHTATLDRLVSGGGVYGEVVFTLIATAACAAGLPRQATAFLGGYAFGTGLGTGLALLAQSLACLATFAWARFVARQWIAQRRSSRLRRIDAVLAAHPFRATLTLRLLPIGNNLLLNLLAGVSSVPSRPFLLASIVGYAPQTVVFALLGAGVRVSKGVQLALGVALFAASMGLGLMLLRRARDGVSEVP